MVKVAYFPPNTKKKQCETTNVLVLYRITLISIWLWLLNVKFSMHCEEMNMDGEQVFYYFKQQRNNTKHIVIFDVMIAILAIRMGYILVYFPWVLCQCVSNEPSHLDKCTCCYTIHFNCLVFSFSFGTVV